MQTIILVCFSRTSHKVNTKKLFLGKKKLTQSNDFHCCRYLEGNLHYFANLEMPWFQSSFWIWPEHEHLKTQLSKVVRL